AAHEETGAAVEVTERASREHERRERERVRVDDPLQAGDLRPELVLDRRQGHVHDQVVEHGHEEPEDHRDQDPPAPAVLRASHRGCRRGFDRARHVPAPSAVMSECSLSMSERSLSMSERSLICQTMVPYEGMVLYARGPMSRAISLVTE